ncbi:Crinkler (CRN) [Phytophthora megakarya]|uniref:Crinkler (CRN) n=1 Tax=Phytophthora megakarya TaxID=4795 RepID=A0A225V269_9STRA|nr:Crinkler (CRN) [Phytophthora megakarya]
MIVLPMFAGTNWSMIQTIPNSSCVTTTDSYEPFYDGANIYSCVFECRLHGAARVFLSLPVLLWVVRYLTKLKNACGQAKTVRLKAITECSGDSWNFYVKYRLRLGACAVAGHSSGPDDNFDEKTKWSKLHNNS